MKYHVFSGEKEKENGGMLNYVGLLSHKSIVELCKESDWGDVVVVTNDGTLRVVAFWEEAGKLQLEEGFAWEWVKS